MTYERPGRRRPGRAGVRSDRRAGDLVHRSGRVAQLDWIGEMTFEDLQAATRRLRGSPSARRALAGSPRATGPAASPGAATPSGWRPAMACGGGPTSDGRGAAGERPGSDGDQEIGYMRAGLRLVFGRVQTAANVGPRNAFAEWGADRPCSGTERLWFRLGLASRTGLLATEDAGRSWHVVAPATASAGRHEKHRCLDRIWPRVGRRGFKHPAVRQRGAGCGSALSRICACVREG